MVGIAGGVEDDVEVEGGVYFGYSGVGGELLLVEGDDGGERFDGSGGSYGVAVEGFGGADGDLRAEGAEELVDGGGFGGVVGLCAGAVGVDVGYFFG